LFAGMVFWYEQTARGCIGKKFCQGQGHGVRGFTQSQDQDSSAGIERVCLPIDQQDLPPPLDKTINRCSWFNCTDCRAEDARYCLTAWMMGKGVRAKGLRGCQDEPLSSMMRSVSWTASPR